jgi:hypothetical protein
VEFTFSPNQTKSSKFQKSLISLYQLENFFFLILILVLIPEENKEKDSFSAQVSHLVSFSLTGRILKQGNVNLEGKKEEVRKTPVFSGSRRRRKEEKSAKITKSLPMPSSGSFKFLPAVLSDVGHFRVRRRTLHIGPQFVLSELNERPILLRQFVLQRLLVLLEQSAVQLTQLLLAQLHHLIHAGSHFPIDRRTLAGQFHAAFRSRPGNILRIFAAKWR